MPACNLCDSEGCAEGLPQRVAQADAGCDSFEADTNCPSLTHMKLVPAQREMISHKLMPAVYKKKPQRNSGTCKCPLLGMLKTFKDICMNL